MCCMTSKTIKVADVLSKRIHLRSLTKKLDKHIPAFSKKITFDFRGVNYMSRSAAHEFLQLQKRLESKVFVKKIILIRNLNSDLKVLFDKASSPPSRKNIAAGRTTTIHINDALKNFF